MCSRVTDAQVHASHSADSLVHASDSAASLASTRRDLPVSIDLVDERLYLGNFTAACDPLTLQRAGVTHVLTVDSVPLPRVVLDNTATTGSLTLKYIKLADVSKEDLITHLPETNEFIQNALNSGGTVLVHCYFGVSRSAAVVIAHIMSKYGLGYEDAFKLVKSKRRFIGPNAGFVAQLKLFGHMGCKLDKSDARFRQFRLKMAGQKLKEVKILPLEYSELVAADPGLERERPDPRVYRCRKCRRIVAAQHNLIPHVPKQVKIELAMRRLRPMRSALGTASVGEQNGELLLQKLKSLTTDTAECGSDKELLVDDAPNEYEGGTVDTSIAARIDAPEMCKLVYFVEPMCWMRGVQQSMQGRLHCPKCSNKIGRFNWGMGCVCLCGQLVAPAFYLMPSKVDHSNVVQNLRITV